ncbi:MAG: AMP-binding protein, partial [Rhodoferax sp.]|nr:AMP-binding protein [Rhodoferax sp.]
MRVSQNRDNYSQLHACFEWLVPEKFNIAQVCCARWAARPDATERVAIHTMNTGAVTTCNTYSELQQQANRLSRVLAVLGVERGDRVAIVMPQRFETAVAYMAVLQMGAVAMPLSMLFGPDALEYRLHDSEAVLAICDESSIASLLAIRENCPLLRSVLGVGGAAAQADVDYADALSRVTPEFAPAVTDADEAAVLIYTSGTTGNPKGALIPHRALIGNLTGFVCSQNWFGFDGQDNAATDAVFWSPADWAWTGGLMDALLPTLYFGRPIVAFKGRFSPQTALELMGQFGVTHTFLFPTALKAMMKAYPGTATTTVRQQFNLKLQAIMSAGEAVGDAVFDYCQAQLGVTVNEMFGQTEINYIVGNCAMNGSTQGGLGWPAKAGSMGKGYPGHRVAVIDEDGNECPVGVAGDVALNRFDVHGHPDPIFFLGYWKNEAATREALTSDGWLLTGDVAQMDEDGYFRIIARKADMWYPAKSDAPENSGKSKPAFPRDIEEVLYEIPQVKEAAVVAIAGNPFAFVIAGRERPTPESVLAYCKRRLPPHLVPRFVIFMDDFPRTFIGKVLRRELAKRYEKYHVGEG